MATAKANTMEPVYKGTKSHSKGSNFQVPGNTEEDAKRALSRCSSLPDDMDAPVTVQLRNASSRSRRKAQLQRNSVAITSSDYYNQRRPQISQLAVVQQTHVPLRTTTAPLHPITENDTAEKDDYRNKRSSMVADLHDLNGVQITDSRLFRYRSNPSLAPAPTSRPTTPQVTNPHFDKVKRHSSLHSSMSSINRADSFLSLNDGVCTPQPMGTPQLGARPLSALRMNSQAIPLTASTENQFLPLYINAESGLVYMFENGYYIPLTAESMKTFQENAITKPPVPDRRSKGSILSQPQPPSQQSPPPPSRIISPPSDYFPFVQVLMVMFTLCLNLPVLVFCAIPAFVCSLQVRKANRKGKYELAKRRSEFVMCFSILGVIFHVFFILAIIATFLLLHFIGGYFTVQ